MLNLSLVAALRLGIMWLTPFLDKMAGGRIESYGFLSHVLERKSVDLIVLLGKDIHDVRELLGVVLFPFEENVVRVILMDLAEDSRHGNFVLGFYL